MTWLKRLGLLFAALGFALGTAEIGYRRCVVHGYRSRLAQYADRNPKSIFEVRPGSAVEFVVKANLDREVEIAGGAPWRVVTDADGFRVAAPGRSDVSAETKNPILILGDSYAFGWGVSGDETFADRLGRSLAPRRVGVVNAAVPGFNTVQQAARFAELVDRIKPAIVVLAYVMNDAEPQHSVPRNPHREYAGRSWIWEDLKEAGRRGGVWDLPIAKHRHDGNYLAGFAADSHKWRQSKAALADVADRCRRHDARLVVAILPDFTRPFDARYPLTTIHQAVADWCVELQIDCVDFWPHFAGRRHTDYWVLGDGHPNAAAHAAIAAGLLGRLPP